MKVTLKSSASVLRFNGKEYGPGDKLEMSEKEAVKIAHHLEEGEELLGGKKPKARELDDPNNQNAGGKDADNAGNGGQA